MSGSSTRRIMKPGIYCPIVTFFEQGTEDLDLPTLHKHVARLAQAGLAGIVVSGSNGEATHLTREERTIITEETRKALDDAGFPDIPIIVGASEQSVRGTIELCQQAKEANGDYVLLLPPSYYRGLVDTSVIKDYFFSVAEASPLPIVLYNYPGAVSGIDMDSDLIIELAQHKNIVGCKFTCANTGKLCRVAQATNASTLSNPDPDSFMAFGGFLDFTLQALVAAGSGVIGGGANVAPKLAVKVFDLFAAGEIEEASRLQKLLAKGDWVLTKGAIPGTKSAVQSYFGYGGGISRRPLQTLSAEQADRIKDDIADMMEVELHL